MMEVILLTSFKFISEMVNNAARAGLTCTANTHKLDDPNYDCVGFLKRRITDTHESVLEHINLTFSIKGISRALLQELARHRHISLSVESTRWTLGKTLLNEDDEIREKVFEKLRQTFNSRVKCFVGEINKDSEGRPAYFDEENENPIIEMIKDMCEGIIENSKNPAQYADFIKYFLPELTPTNLVMTCNLRELRHIYKLRAEPPALKEFNDLCAAIKNTLPNEIQELLVFE